MDKGQRFQVTWRSVLCCALPGHHSDGCRCYTIVKRVSFAGRHAQGKVLSVNGNVCAFQVQTSEIPATRNSFRYRKLAGTHGTVDVGPYPNTHSFPLPSHPPTQQYWCICSVSGPQFFRLRAKAPGQPRPKIRIIEVRLTPSFQSIMRMITQSVLTGKSKRSLVLTLLCYTPSREVEYLGLLG